MVSYWCVPLSFKFVSLCLDLETLLNSGLIFWQDSLTADVVYFFCKEVHDAKLFFVLSVNIDDHCLDHFLLEFQNGCILILSFLY